MASSATQYVALPRDPDELEKLFNHRLSQLPKTPIDLSRQNLTIFEILAAEPRATNFLRHLASHQHLADTLKSTTDGEYTAFVAVDDGWTEEDHGRSATETMFSIHITPHYYDTDSLPSWTNVPTILRTASSHRAVLNITFDSSALRVNGSKIVKANIRAKNGMVHFIEKPCLALPDLRSVLKSGADLSYMAQVIALAGDIISKEEAQTILAPSDDAFRTLGEDVLTFLFHSDEGRPYLSALLKLHILPKVTVLSNLIFPKNDTGDRIASSDVLKPIKGTVHSAFDTLLKAKDGKYIPMHLTFYRYSGLIAMKVGETATVVVPDVSAKNGSLHVIDTVLLPRRISSETGVKALSVDELKAVLCDYV